METNVQGECSHSLQTSRCLDDEDWKSTSTDHFRRLFGDHFHRRDELSCSESSDISPPASHREASFSHVSMDSKEISPVERHIFREKSRQDISRRLSCSGPFYGGSSMNGPPFPADRPTAHPHRLEQSLTRLAPAVSGAAPHPVLLRIRHTELGSLGEVETRCGEGGNNFILHSFLHRSTSPSSSAKPMQANTVSSPQPQNSAGK